PAMSMLAVNIPIKLPPQLANRVLVASLASGGVAELLFDATPWGMNLALAVLVVVITAFLVGRRSVVLEGEGRWLALPALFFAACLAWRDSPTLNVANACALLAAGSLAVLSARAGQIRRAGVTQYVIAVAYVG